MDRAGPAPKRIPAPGRVSIACNVCGPFAVSQSLAIAGIKSTTAKRFEPGINSQEPMKVISGTAAIKNNALGLVRLERLKVRRMATTVAIVPVNRAVLDCENRMPVQTARTRASQQSRRKVMRPD